MAVEVAAGEQLLQRLAAFGRFGAQGEMRDVELEVVLGSKACRTGRTEVAPRSDVVGRHFEGDGCHR